MPKATFCFDSHCVSVETPAESLLSDAALLADIVLNTHCGGLGVCNGCAVDLIAGEFRSVGGQLLTPSPGKRIRALACQTIATSNEFTVSIPQRSLVEAGEKVLVDFDLGKIPSPDPPVRVISLELPRPELADSAGHFERICRQLHQEHACEPVTTSLEVLRDLPEVLNKNDFKISVSLVRKPESWELIDVRSVDTAAKPLALAIDIGTTTVVVALADLSGKPRIVDAASSYNQQVACCADVASRISYACSSKRIEELRRLVVEATINRLISLLLQKNQLAPRDILMACVAGNTVMMHLFLGLDPTSIGRLPFEPVVSAPGLLTASEVGLNIHPRGKVRVLPAIAAYVGPDITADLLVCDIQESEDLSLMVDIGTNAEMCLGSSQGCWACATPAGPAFEGAGLSFGVRASAGAIETISIDPQTFKARCEVIGGEKPFGICGSALIDFLAEGFKRGLLERTGRINPALVDSCPYVRKVKLENNNEITEYVLVPAKESEDGKTDIVITEKDIEALLQAKAVIFAGIRILLKHVGKKAAELRRVYLAGAFARHINLANGVASGLLPDIPLERYHFIGNGSLGGAFLSLVDNRMHSQADSVVARPKVIELNLDPDFMDQYTLAMFLPHMDQELFPSVQVS
ncbi:MAG: DUF4445 domain-containing protein [Actinobacteria bacterium]|nr:DUF4445 domain-containing protein [Actinomycetota bacterium]